MSNTDFINFKPLVENSQFNWSIFNNKSKMNWNNIKEVSTSFETPFELDIKYNLDSVVSIKVSLIRKRQKGRYFFNEL